MKGSEAFNEMKGKILQEIAEQRGKMLDDFIKAYLDVRFGKYADKEGLMKRIRLVEQRSPDRLRTEWWIELKKGPLPKSKKAGEEIE